MKTNEIYNLAIEKGMEADLRGKEFVQKLLHHYSPTEQ